MLCAGWGSWSDVRFKQNRVHLPTKVSRKEGRKKHTMNEQQDRKFMKHMVSVVCVLQHADWFGYLSYQEGTYFVDKFSG